MRSLGSRPGRERFAPPERGKLVGLYLNQTNKTGRYRDPMFANRERSDGRYAQRRTRD
ncbi:MAG: hypothetical protein ACO34E_19790 [Limisphaerales bacterium]